MHALPCAERASVDIWEADTTAKISSRPFTLCSSQARDILRRVSRPSMSNAVGRIFMIRPVPVAEQTVRTTLRLMPCKTSVLPLWRQSILHSRRAVYYGVAVSGAMAKVISDSVKLNLKRHVETHGLSCDVRTVMVSLEPRSHGPSELFGRLFVLAAA